MLAVCLLCIRASCINTNQSVFRPSRWPAAIAIFLQPLTWLLDRAILITMLFNSVSAIAARLLEPISHDQRSHSVADFITLLISKDNNKASA